MDQDHPDAFSREALSVVLVIARTPDNTSPAQNSFPANWFCESHISVLWKSLGHSAHWLFPYLTTLYLRLLQQKTIIFHLLIKSKQFVFFVLFFSDALAMPTTKEGGSNIGSGYLFLTFLLSFREIQGENTGNS